MEKENRSEIEKKIDILEDDIAEIHPSILAILLKDKTTQKNILWGTNDYEEKGPDYDAHKQIKIDLITGINYDVIQPRAAKSKEIQEKRIKNRAEVFTPTWIVNEQNNQVDDKWFGRKNVFNVPSGTIWTSTKENIEFEQTGKTWEDYVTSKRLEITCGEAPYLVSRYDPTTTTGEVIPLSDRVGLFDRKMRVVNENCQDGCLWLKWSLKALKSVYGYEFQGDSVLIARENLLFDYIDYYQAKFSEKPSIELLSTVANIIAWNIWQMDGVRYVVPYSCHEEHTSYQLSMFDLEQEQETKYRPCPGCEKNNVFAHNGKYCRIFDWTNLNKSILFIDVYKEGLQNGKI